MIAPSNARLEVCEVFIVGQIAPRRAGNMEVGDTAHSEPTNGVEKKGPDSQLMKEALIRIMKCVGIKPGTASLGTIVEAVEELAKEVKKREEDYKSSNSKRKVDTGVPNVPLVKKAKASIPPEVSEIHDVEQCVEQRFQEAKLLIKDLKVNLPSITRLKRGMSFVDGIKLYIIGYCPRKTECGVICITNPILNSPSTKLQNSHLKPYYLNWVTEKLVPDAYEEMKANRIKLNAGKFSITEAMTSGVKITLDGKERNVKVVDVITSKSKRPIVVKELSDSVAPTKKWFLPKSYVEHMHPI